jgi:thioredoxin reductase
MRAMESNWDVVIVGGSAAGLSAGLSLARSRRRVAIVDAGVPRNRFAAHMHGVLGHDGKPPQELVAAGRREVERYGGIIINATATGAVRSGDTFAVTTDGHGREIMNARRLIVATGLRDELPEVDGLREQWGKGVVACPYCDGYENRDKRIGILGTSAFSLHQVQLLRQWSPNTTYFVHMLEAPNADERRALEARGIAIENGIVTKICSDEGGRLTGLELADGRHIGVDVIFITPRPVPLDGVLGQLGADVTESPFGRFVTVDPTYKTSIPGVWAVGNVTDAVANVPVSMGAGSFAGAAVNADLVTEDIAWAVRALTI